MHCAQFSDNITVMLGIGVKFWRMKWQEQEGKFGMEETEAFVFQDRPEEDLHFVKDVVRKLAGDGSLEVVLQKKYLSKKCDSDLADDDIVQKQIHVQADEGKVEKKDQNNMGFWSKKSQFEENQNVHETSYAGQNEDENKMFNVLRITNIRSESRNINRIGRSQSFESYMKIEKRKVKCDQQNSEHSNLKKIECQQCGKKFKSKYGFEIHMKRHNQQFDHKCSSCGAAFMTSSHLSVHRLARHTDGHRFTCIECGKGFKSKGSLKTHKSVHAGERNHQCRFCDDKFRNEWHQKSHERIHTDVKKHLCTICLKLFMRKPDLTVHMKMHLNQKEHVCEVCKKAFIRFAGLRRHKCRDKVEGSLSFHSKHLRSVGQ